MADTLLPLLVVSIFFSYVHSQGLGPSNCLISRIDTVPCSFNNRATQPGVNEFGIYVTRYRLGQGGFPVCRILAREEEIRPIRTIGSLNEVFVFYSPGFTLDQPYGESQYIKYNMQCGKGRVAFFNISRIDMEGRTCNDRGVMRCVDYVILENDEFGETESCGNETSESNVNQFLPGNVSVIFRTNFKKNSRGFQGSIICVNRSDGDMEGCTRPAGTNMTNMTATSPGRKERDLENFGLVPSPEELAVLAKLAEAQAEFAREDESERLTTEFLEQPSFDPLDIGLLPIRNRRQKTEEPLRSFPDQAVMVALEYENACNPVLRASALSIIETLQETEGGQMQLERLRAELLTTTAPQVSEQKYQQK